MRTKINRQSNQASKNIISHNHQSKKSKDVTSLSHLAKFRDPSVELSPDTLLTLQRTIGNKNVIQLLRDRQSKNEQKPAQVKLNPTRNSSIQRAIGLEIEVPVPIDQLNDEGVDYIEDKAGGPLHTATLGEKLSAKGRRDVEGKVTYGVVHETDKIRVDADHDDRVKTPDPYEEGKGWPLPEGGLDSIIEIVTKPASDEDTFNEQMDEVDTLVGDIDGNTNGLTTHWEGAYDEINVGPLDYTSKGRAPKKQTHHNFDGSIQVNLGVSLSNYGQLLEEYTETTYADPERAKDTERKSFEDAKLHIEMAVEAAKSEGERLRKKYKKKITEEHNQLKGIEGWLTHVAMYLIRGTAEDVGGTSKNLAPVLLKSPSSVASMGGMTNEERAFYQKYQKNIVMGLLKRVGRKKDAKKFGRWKNQKVFPKQSIKEGGDITIEELASITGAEEDVLLAGTTIGNTGDDSDMVVEFRTMPGYYQPGQWRELGLNYLRKAEQLKEEAKGD